MTTIRQPARGTAINEPERVQWRAHCFHNSIHSLLLLSHLTQPSKHWPSRYMRENRRHKLISYQVHLRVSWVLIRAMTCNHGSGALSKMLERFEGEHTLDHTWLAMPPQYGLCCSDSYRKLDHSGSSTATLPRSGITQLNLLTFGPMCIGMEIFESALCSCPVL